MKSSNTRHKKAKRCREPFDTAGGVSPFSTDLAKIGRAHLASGKMGDCMHGGACAFGREILIEILEEAGGLMSSSALCFKFYQHSEAARVHVREGHGSFKAFITKTALVKALDFVPDTVTEHCKISVRTTVS